MFVYNATRCQRYSAKDYADAAEIRDLNVSLKNEDRKFDLWESCASDGAAFSKSALIMLGINDDIDQLYA